MSYLLNISIVNIVKEITYITPAIIALCTPKYIGDITLIRTIYNITLCNNLIKNIKYRSCLYLFIIKYYILKIELKRFIYMNV